MDKIISIQLLRGIASILVLILHAVHKEHTYGSGDFPNFNSGHLGVDIFFIISGFVMLYTYDSSLGAKSFLLKRAIRILPIYWITLSLAVAVYLVHPNLINSGREVSLIGSIFLIPTDALFINQNAWTLTYEFLFYFIFSSVFILSRKVSLKFVVFTILLLAVVGLLFEPSAPLLKVLTSSLMIEFTYGFFLFYFIQYCNKSKKAFLIFVLCIIIILLQQVKIDDWERFRFIQLGFPALTICCVIVYFEKNIVGITAKVSNFLGDISYSLYLVHPFSLAGTAIMMKFIGVSNSYVFMFLLTLSSILCGWLVFRYIEQPLTKKIQTLYYKVVSENSYTYKKLNS